MTTDKNISKIQSIEFFVSFYTEFVLECFLINFKIIAGNQFGFHRTLELTMISVSKKANHLKQLSINSSS